MIQRFVGERRAISAIVLAFFGLTYLVLGLLSTGQPFAPMLIGLSATYLVGFFALVAGYFWARWYVMGLAFSGFATAIIAMFQLGTVDPIFIFWGGTHGLALLALVGRGPAALFDARKDWRERYHMNDDAAQRLGKAITRAGASLPYLVQVGLAPRQSLALVFGVGALVLGVLGVSAIVRMRTWGFFAFAGSIALLFGAHSLHHLHHHVTLVGAVHIAHAPAFAAALLGAAILPFVRPIGRALT